jgi:2-hydroxychromene-2-carboxylate isomerase
MAIIEYFYSAHSAFAYIGAGRLGQICEQYGCKLHHRPMDLGPVMQAAGGQPFSARSRGHVEYFFGREIERWAEWRDVPIIRHRPRFHDNPLALPNGMIIAAAELGSDADRLSFAILQAHWRDDADIADAGVLRRIADGLGLDAGRLLAAAMAPETQAQSARNTDEAIARNVFGSPTYVLDGDMFYGQDRLEMLERALTRPFRPATWNDPAKKT